MKFTNSSSQPWQLSFSNRLRLDMSVDARTADSAFVIRSRAFLSRPAASSPSIFASASFKAICLEAALPTSQSNFDDILGVGADVRLRVARESDFHAVRTLFCACMQEHQAPIPVCNLF
jgi:hypothetical protein